MKVLVTGANGFIGTRLCAHLAGSGLNEVIGVTRREMTWSLPVRLVCQPGDWAQAEWGNLLNEVDVVVHLAGKAHAGGAEALDEYRKVNVAATRRIAMQCVEFGVHRFVFVSSIKVNGEESPKDGAFYANDQPHPVDAYGISKWEAEQTLREIAGKSELEAVVVRPPLVYGLGVKGNFAKLVKIVCAGVPLPLGAVDNARSLVGVDNLVDLLERCTWHPRAAGQTFLVSDGEDLSTPDLIRRIAALQKRSPRLLRVPPSLLRWCAQLAGRTAAADRLLGSLLVDTDFTRQTLEWSPPCNVTEGLRQVISAPLNMEKK